jgi:hypothetical protein
MSRTALPLQENPVRVARTLLHRTLVQAASGAGIHWQVWYLTECGCYETIPKKIKNFLNKHDTETRINITELESNYRGYQLGNRKAFGDTFKQYSLSAASLQENPFASFRAVLGITRANCAKRLCVQPAILYKVETGRSRNLPESLLNALKDADLPVELIEELDTRLEEFYEHFNR